MVGINLGPNVSSCSSLQLVKGIENPMAQAAARGKEPTRGAPS
jgi:hypothetical protein